MAKILQVLGSLGRGGAETMVMNYYREFSKNGIQFDFVVHANAVNGYEDEVRALGGNIIMLPRPGEIGAFRYIKALQKAISENGPYDVVHMHTDIQCFMGVIAAKRCNVKTIVMHSHNTRFRRFAPFINRLVGSLYKAKRLACGDAAGRAFYRKKRFTVIQNAMNIDRFLCAPQNEVLLQKRKWDLENKYVIGHIGRFVEQKNHKFLIHMVAPILKDNPHAVLCLAGGGELRPEIEALCETLDILGQVRFLGVCDNVNILYHMYDLVILPSRFEGLPLTVIEAQVAGKPIICSDVVTTECDLDLGLIQFLPLDETCWGNLITKYIHKEILPPTPAFAEIKQKAVNFDIEKQSKTLMKIYGVIQ